MSTTGRTPLPPGTRIGRFELVTELDRDEVSAVWAARILGPRTAARAARVQVLEPRVAADLELRTLFLREAKAATKIKHPAFAPVLDAGPHGSGGAHLATAYFDAGSLSELMQAASDRNVRLPADIVLRIVCDVLDPLAEMHAVRLETAGSTRLLHGDLRPDAILVTLEGVVRLVPSCAGAAACRQPLASVVKRLAYKAPEQIRHEGVGASIDARADQFALGTILWEAFAGRRPFNADETVQLVRSVLTDAVESIATVAPDIEPGVAKIVDRLLSRDPEARYYDVEELSTELKRAVGPRLADRSRVALAVRELIGARIDQRREFIRRKCANDELERAALPDSEVAEPGSAAKVPVGRVVQVPSGNTIPWIPDRPPPPPRKAQSSQPGVTNALEEAEPVAALVAQRGLEMPRPAPARVVVESTPARASPQLMRPPPPPARLPAVEELDPPTQRTGSSRVLKAAAPVGINADRAELSRAVVESPLPPERPLSKKPIVAIGPRDVTADDDEVPTARPRDLRTPPPDDAEPHDGIAGEDAEDFAAADAEPHEPDASRTAPTLPPARRGRRSKRSQLQLLVLLGLGVFVVTFGIVALRRRAEPPPDPSTATEPSPPSQMETARPVATEPPPSPVTSTAKPAMPSPEPEPEPTAKPLPAPAPLPAQRPAKNANEGKSTVRGEQRPRAPMVKQPAVEQPIEPEPVDTPAPKPKPVDDRMLDDI